MYVAVKTASGQDFTFSGNDFGPWPDNDVDTILRVRIASLADFVDPPVS